MWAALGCNPPQDALAELLGSYGLPERSYHSTEHLDESLRVFRQVEELADSPHLVELAIWYHDAVYDSHRDDNEERSAEWARRVTIDAGGTPADADRVVELIMATEHRAPAAGGDEALVADIDLAILGADPARFDAYEDAVRREYSWVTDEAYRAGRRAVLERFLDRPRVYATAWFSERLEDQARSNLRRSLTRLAEGAGR